MSDQLTRALLTLAVGLTAAPGCGSQAPGGDSATGGSEMGGSATAGSAAAGSAGAGAATAGSATGGAATGGAATGGSATGGAATGGSPMGGAGGTSGAAATGGSDAAGSGGMSGSGGASAGSGGASSGSGGVSAGSGGGGRAGAGAGGTGNGGGGSSNGGSGGFGGGPARSLGYVGCSMSVNVAQGYQALGGMRLWAPVSAYNGKVVQNWANTNDSAWQAFQQQATANGTPSAVWVMICIFTNMVTYEETKQIIANVRQRAPNAAIYITGQPLYAQGLTCDLSGSGGPEKTDMMAQMAGDDSTLENVTYAGTFGPLTSAQRSDSCHANTEGQRALGQQAIGKFGN